MQVFYPENYEHPLCSSVAIYNVNFNNRRNKKKILKYCLSIDGTVGICSVYLWLSVCIFVVSATRRSRDIKITVVSVGPRSEKFNIVRATIDARKNTIFAFQFGKPILQTITHLIQ